MSNPVESPGDRGLPATTLGAAAIIAALALPTVARFPQDDPAFLALPSFIPGQEPPAGPGESLPTQVDIARAVMDDCVETLTALQRLEHATAACRAAVVERLDAAAYAEGTALGFDRWQRELSAMTARADIATTLTVTESAAAALIEHDTALVREHQATWAALQAGELSWAHAVVILDECRTLASTGVNPIDLGSFEQLLLDRAGASTVPSFRQHARRLRARSHPESIATRTTEAFEKRSMHREPGEDGMSWLTLTLPAPTVEGIWDHCTQVARAAQNPGEPRTLTQLRADVAATLLLGQDLAGFGTDAGTSEAAGAGLPPFPRAQVLLTVPLLSLLGLGNTPAELQGYGPVSVEVARRLTANSPSFLRVLTDPVTGEALDLSPTVYKISKKMRTMLRARDEYCQFPQCSAKASLSELDHLRPWNMGGLSTAANCEHLCKHHHKVKHFKDDLTRNGKVRTRHSPERSAMKLRGWTPIMTPSGHPAWRSPSGKYHPAQEHDLPAPSYPKWLKKFIDASLAGMSGAETIAGASGTESCTSDPPLRPDRPQISKLDYSPAEALFVEYLGR